MGNMKDNPKNPVSYIIRYPHLQTEKLCLLALQKDLHKSINHIKIFSKDIQEYIAYEYPIYLGKIPTPLESTLDIIFNRGLWYQFNFFTTIPVEYVKKYLDAESFSIKYLYKHATEEMAANVIKKSGDVYYSILEPSEELTRLQKILWEV